VPARDGRAQQNSYSVPRTTKAAETYDLASDFDSRKETGIEKAPLVEVHREGAFHPGARLHLCAGHAVGVARLQCDERLNRMALRATLQPLGRGCRAGSNSYSRCP
jgi:hypothetical protein